MKVMNYLLTRKDPDHTHLMNSYVLSVSGIHISLPSSIHSLHDVSRNFQRDRLLVPSCIAFMLLFAFRDAHYWIIVSIFHELVPVNGCSRPLKAFASLLQVPPVSIK